MFLTTMNVTGYVYSDMTTEQNRMFFGYVLSNNEHELHDYMLRLDGEKITNCSTALF